MRSGVGPARVAFALGFLGIVAGLGGCVVREIEEAPGLGSFRVELVAIETYDKLPGCENAPERGTRECPRPFPPAADPTRVVLRAQALDRRGEPMDFDGSAQVDVRPGEIADIGPAGPVLRFEDGQSEDLEIPVIHASGRVRIWVEDCGTPDALGSFATGVSEELNFERPRILDLQLTADNTASPIQPRADNVCALSGDPRYGLAVNEDNQVEFVGLSEGGAVNVPPPAIGTFIEVVGCSRAEYDAALAAGESCRRGPLVVTSIDNAGFYVADVNPESLAQGFNHLYAFNFSYPDDLEVGDLLLSLKGSPTEFSGSTQLANPAWRRDGVGRGRSLLPPPRAIELDVYEESLRTFGRNQDDALQMEALEGTLVCVDQIAPSPENINCDRNGSGRIEREGCQLDELPTRCEDGGDLVPVAPACDPDELRPYCLPLSEAEILACDLESTCPPDNRVCYIVPANPEEYCCERACYLDYACNEASASIAFGQWVGDVYGRYEPAPGGGALGLEPVKLAFVTRDADPTFDPSAFATAELAKPAAERRHLRIVGNLRHVLSARPVWVVVARTPADITIVEGPGGCDDLLP